MSDGGAHTARSDLLGGAGWVVFGSLIVAESLRMDRFTQMGATLYTMPGFVPGMIGVVLILLGALLCLRGWRKRQNGLAQQPGEPLFNQRIVITLALSLVYAIGLIGRVHFVLATTLFVGAFVWMFTPEEVPRRKRAVVAALAGVIAALVVFFVFEDLFLVRLP
jgi:hypothetical protein